MFSNASNFVEGVDMAFAVILGIAVFFLIGITITMIFFIYRYNKKRNPKATQIEGSNTLEIIWTLIPLALVMLMFFYGWTGWKPMKEKAPDDALQVKAYARMWSFAFEYPNGKIIDSLYVPQGKAVELDLIAQDVIHSLYIPAFRLKQDMVPGKKDRMWFIANAPGTYDLFCAEYCGQRHSYMYTSVVVMPDDKFDQWYVDTTAVEQNNEKGKSYIGESILKKNGCFACHSTDGSPLVGPTFKGIIGKTETVLEDKNEIEVTVDMEYIKTSIYNPNTQVVKGYNKGQMLSYENLIKEEEIELIYEYLESLK